MRRALTMAAVVGLFVAACTAPAGAPGSGPTTEDARDGGTSGGPRYTPGIRAAGSSTPSDASTAMEEPEGPAEPTWSEGCDSDCDSDLDCDTGQSCFTFAEGKKCAPSECGDCILGCVFDLQTCTFTRCSAPNPTPKECGAVCETDDECGDGQICRDVFGIKECSPAECVSCMGYCDYLLDSCEYDECYVATGSRPGMPTPGGPTFWDNWYCGHPFD